MPSALPIIYTPGGLDLRLPDTMRDRQSAVNGLNFDITPALSLVKRRGYQMVSDDVSGLGYGLVAYESREPTVVSANGFGDFAFGVEAFGSPTTLGFGLIDLKLVGLGTNPAVWTAGTFGITYSGAGAATVKISATSESDVKLVLSVDGSAVLTEDLGAGTEGSPVTMTALKTAIDAVADFASTITGTATTPAAFLDKRNTKALTSGTEETIGFGYWNTINSPLATPLPEVGVRQGRDDFENPSAVSLNGVLYISNGYDDMLKYDGQNLYKAGLPQPGQPTTALDTGTGVGGGFSGSYQYLIQYKQIDAVLNTLEGQASTTSTALDNSAGPYAIDVTIDTVSSSEGYNTNCAVVDGTQTSTNVGDSLERLTVDDGSGGNHTLKVGDTAYFYDKNSTDYVTKEVMAVTGTTIDLSSAAALSVDDNVVMSNNLRLVIWRTEAGGSTYRLVEEIPNNSFTSSVVYKDETLDNALGALYAAPTDTPATPPKCRYMAVWKNNLIMAGDPLNPTRVYYSEFSDVTNPENFPVTNFFEASPGAAGGAVSGLGVVAQDLIVFTEDACYYGAGNLANDDITLSEISREIGCLAHHSIGILDGQLMFLSKKGIYAVAPGAFRNQGLKKISDPLDPIFRTGANNNFRKSYKRAVGVVWPEAQKYLLYMPDGALDNGEWYGQATSRIYAVDLDFGYWFQWSNMESLGGMVIWDDDATDSDRALWFQSRELDSTVQHRLYKTNYTYSEIDYADHVSSVNMTYQPQWEFFNNPRTQKIFNEMVIDAFRGNSQLSYTPTGTTTVKIFRDFDDSAPEVTFTFDFLSNDKEIVKALPWSMRRSLGLEFSNNTINEQILITGWTLEGTEYRREIRR